MSGIDTGYAATKGLIASGELGSGQVPPYAMSDHLGMGCSHAQRSGTALRASYAMSGTDVAYAAAIRYAMSGAVRSRTRVGSAICLRARYAMSGTGLAHSAPLPAYALPMRCPVQTWHMVLPGSGCVVSSSRPAALAW
eukprot:2461482-Rhodomonas_salina.12